MPQLLGNFNPMMMMNTPQPMLNNQQGMMGMNMGDDQNYGGGHIQNNENGYNN